MGREDRLQSPNGQARLEANTQIREVPHVVEDESACRQEQASPRLGVRLSKRHLVRVLACLVSVAVLTGAAQPGQQTPSPSPVLSKPSSQTNPSSNAVTQQQTRNRQTGQQAGTAENAERSSQLAEESAKLLKLATDLKTEVDRTTMDTLSLEVIRKSGEVEKLARNVKKEMQRTEEASR